jgi:putative FmdB family regulatory protein
MPVYEYRCQDCGWQLTIQRRLYETSQLYCSNCGSKNLKRIISNFSVAKSMKDRTKDPSWIDKDISNRLRKKARS